MVGERQVTSEAIFVVEAEYAADAAETRKPYRAEHLRRVAELREGGVFLEAGAYTDRLSTSVMLIRAESPQEALGIARGDIYVRTGVWTHLTVRPFGRVVGLAQTGPDA